MINFNRQSKQCTDCFVVMERCRMFSFKRRKRNVSIVANNYCDYCFMESILGDSQICIQSAVVFQLRQSFYGKT